MGSDSPKEVYEERLSGEIDGVSFELIVRGPDLIEVLKQRNAAFRRILGVPDVIQLTTEDMKCLEILDLERIWRASGGK